MSSDNDRLLGTWKLLSASSTDASGARIDPPYGASPVGFLTYTEDHRVTALISYTGRKSLSIAAKGAALMEEQAEAFRTFLAYAGRYRLSGDRVIHSIEVSSIQNYVGKDLVRGIKLQGDRIVLSAPPTMVNGKVQSIDLVWERLAPGS